jgi:cell wall-associated NlpC family hydrolase
VQAETSPEFNTAAPPPTASGGLGALQAAESQLGVPYVWGGDCRNLALGLP